MKHSFSVFIHTKDKSRHLCNDSTFPQKRKLIAKLPPLRSDLSMEIFDPSSKKTSQHGQELANELSSAAVSQISKQCARSVITPALRFCSPICREGESHSRRSSGRGHGLSFHHRACCHGNPVGSYCYCCCSRDRRCDGRLTGRHPEGNVTFHLHLCATLQTLSVRHLVDRRTLEAEPASVLQSSPGPACAKTQSPEIPVSRCK